MAYFILPQNKMFYLCPAHSSEYTGRNDSELTKEEYAELVKSIKKIVALNCEKGD